MCLSHAGILDGAFHDNTFRSDDVVMCFSSLYWISGWIALIAGTLNGATRLITTETFTPELYLRFIEQYKVTFAMSSPHNLALILKCGQLHQTDLTSIRLQWVAGGKCSYQVQQKMNSVFPNGKVYTMYGLTEANWGMTFNSNPKDCVGQLLSCYKIKIIDDDGNRSGIGEDGEIRFKANYRFLGYYNDQKSSEEVFDEEGFIMTGDVGHFDEDGDLFIVDRKKDILKYCGFQISPSQIESYLIGSSKIKSVCIVGIPDTSKDTDLPTAFVIRAENSKITEKEIVVMVAGGFHLLFSTLKIFYSICIQFSSRFSLNSDHFADYCKLRGGVYFVDSLPVTPSGKILRRKVREQAYNLRQ